jgi:tetratricopeptide (TPR) repeat protein
MTEQDKVVGELLQRLAILLLEAMSKQEHKQSKCSKKVQNLMDEGVKLARSGMLDRAIEKFCLAAKADPKFVGARIQLIKAYRAQDRKLEAFAIGSHALAIANDAESRCRIYNFMGQICQDLFEKTKSQSDALQAISFFESARSSDTQDILPVWNLIDIHVLVHINKFTSVDDSQHIEKAKQHFRTLLDMARNGKGNVARYLPDIISEAKIKLLSLNDDWWNSQLLELEQSRDSQVWHEDLPVNTFSKRKLAKVLALATLTFSLAGAKPLPHLPPPVPKPLPPIDTPYQQKPNTSLSQPSTSISLYPLKDEQLAAIGHDWGDVKFIALEHDWGDLRTKMFA